MDFTAKHQQQHVVNSKYQTRSSDRNDVISNVPAIISTNASPIDTVPPNPLSNLVGPLRHNRILQKSNCSEFDPNAKLNQQPSQFLHTKSDELTYCTKCGGLTNYDKHNLTKKRYFSLDKECNERTTNFLQCFAMNSNDPQKSESENLLSNSRKQCSFDAGTSEKSFGRLSNGNANNSKTKQSSDDKSYGKNGTNLSWKKGNTQRECTTSCSNRSLKDKSHRSSQNSLRDNRSSRKNSVFLFGATDRDSNVQKPKKHSQQYSRKASTRGPINLHEEQDSETREILLGGTTSHSKFDKFAHEIKIPEPVEAVCLSLYLIFATIFFLFENKCSSFLW